MKQHLFEPNYEKYSKSSLKIITTLDIVLDRTKSFESKIVDTIKKIISNQTAALLHRKNDEVIPLVLASASPTKQKILQLLGIAFSCDPADIDETEVQAISPEELVVKIAQKKAEVVRQRHKKSLIVAADTLIFHEGKPIGKPSNVQSAHEILRRLSDNEHLAMTGLAIWDPISKQMKTHVEVAVVQFHSLNDEIIEQYVETGEPMGKAGAYALQGKGNELVKSLSGDRTNVYGLPVKALLNILSSLNYDFVAQSA